MKDFLWEEGYKSTWKRRKEKLACGFIIVTNLWPSCAPNKWALKRKKKNTQVPQRSNTSRLLNKFLRQCLNLFYLLGGLFFFFLNTWIFINDTVQHVAWNWDSHSLSYWFSLSTGSATCPPGLFSCPGSYACVSRNWLCDGERDCPDGSDELAVAGCGNFNHDISSHKTSNFLVHFRVFTPNHIVGTKWLLLILLMKLVNKCISLKFGNVMNLFLIFMHEYFKMFKFLDSVYYTVYIKSILFNIICCFHYFTILPKI